MMIKVFTKNKNDKIELTEKELKEILDEAYWDGYRAASGTTFTYTSPKPWWDPYVYTTCSDNSISTVTLSNNVVDPVNMSNQRITGDGDH